MAKCNPQHCKSPFYCSHPVSSKWGVLLIVINIFGLAEARVEAWKLFQKTENSKYYYDERNTFRLTKNVVRVWVKQVYIKKRVEDKSEGPPFEKLSYSIKVLDCDCSAKSIRFLSISHYSKDGDVLDLKNPPDQWQSIPTNSMFETLYEAVCN